jgi:hypothetical protein
VNNSAAQSASPQPTPIACAGRRILAKLVDVTLFGTMSLVVGRLLIPEQVSLGGLVPAVGTTLWALGFFVAADTVFARLLGASPGEFLAGIRVMMADGSKLTWSARQDRTTDALVDGTIGAVSLLRCLIVGKPISYDRDSRVVFLSISSGQRAAVGVLTIMTFAVLLSAGLWLTVVRAIDTDTQVAASKVLRYFGVPARAVWANPVTGMPVALPPGWRVGNQIHRVALGDSVAEFLCEAEKQACRIALGLTAWHETGLLDATRNTTREAMQDAFRLVLAENGAYIVDDWPSLSGESRWNQIYSAVLANEEAGTSGEEGVGLAWFSDRKHAWVLSIKAPRREDGAVLSNEEQAFVMQLVQSAYGKQGR